MEIKEISVSVKFHKNLNYTYEFVEYFAGLKIDVTKDDDVDKVFKLNFAECKKQLKEQIFKQGVKK